VLLIRYYSYTNRYLQAEKKANAQTAHLFFCQREKPKLKKIKELFFSTAKKIYELDTKIANNHYIC